MASFLPKILVFTLNLLTKFIENCYHLSMIDIKELVTILSDNKMKNVCVYDLSENDESKFVVVSTANKTVDSKKMADILAEKYAYSEKIEGYFKGEWIVFDLDAVTVHIFLPKIREKYNLDKLYKPKKIAIK